MSDNNEQSTSRGQEMTFNNGGYRLWPECFRQSVKNILPCVEPKHFCIVKKY